MTPRKVAIGKGIVALSIIALALAALLGFVLLTSQSMVKTVTSTTTVIPAQQAMEIVGGVFAQHMLSLTSGNVSTIVSRYEGNANVTWTGHGGEFCYGGRYAGSNFMTLFGVFFRQVLPALAIENVTRTVTPETNGLVMVNSTFDFAGHGVTYGNVNGTVSAYDSYAYSATNGALADFAGDMELCHIQRAKPNPALWGILTGVVLVHDKRRRREGRVANP